MKKYLKLLPVLMICLALVACKGKTLIKEDISGQSPDTKVESVVVPDEEAVGEVIASEEIGEEELAGGAAKAGGAEAATAPSSKDLAGNTLYMVHFDFDKYVIKDEFKDKLRNNAQWLKKHPGVKVVIEGHADERGENEYNLALGEKRAMSVVRYLKSLGVDTSRLSTISYGEERPLDPGHNESAWAKNRRAEFRTSE